MELSEFDKSLSKLIRKLKGSFFRKPNRCGINGLSVYGKMSDFQLQVKVITSRLVEDIAEHEVYTKLIFDSLDSDTNIGNSNMKKSILNLERLIIDLSDFYLYTRMFLDTITIGIKLALLDSGNKNACYITNSFSCVLNVEKMKTFKEKIDLGFFVGLEKYLPSISRIRDSRDNLVHYYHHLVFTLTAQGKLGYEIIGNPETSWGTDTVKDITVEIQQAINNLVALIEYLNVNLPINQKSSKP